MPKSMSLAERLEHYTVIKPNSGCLIWTGKFTGGRLSYPKYPVYYQGHKTIYVCREVIKVPPGLEACHSCDTPSCVNVNHLFIGTHKQNMEDAKAKGRMFPQGNMCRYGHPMSGANLYIHGRRRHCRLCANARNREYRRRYAAA